MASDTSPFIRPDEEGENLNPHDLKIGDKVKDSPVLLAGYPQAFKDYYASRTGEIIEIYENGWCEVRWDKPAWDSDEFEATEALIILVPAS